jgi:hypothetical protein
MKYIYHSPRGFSNEISIYSYDPNNAVEASEVERMLNSERGWCKSITRKEAERICAKNRKEGGSYENPTGAKEIIRLADYLREHKLI